jgi:hypothetical protein
MEKPEDPKSKTDFDDIKAAFDAELKERVDKTDDVEKRKEIIAALRNK